MIVDENKWNLGIFNLSVFYAYSSKNHYINNHLQRKVVTASQS